jgi:predicted PurR-regulated permease PerM
VGIPTGLAFTNVFMIATLVGALFFARDILVPIALAVLLTFILVPVVALLQRWRLPKPLAVMSAVVLAFSIILGLGAMVMTQVNQLATDLPRYQTTLTDKIHNLREFFGSTGVLRNASGVLNDLNRELNSSEKVPLDTGAAAASAPAIKQPLQVEIHQPDPGASESLVAIIRPLVSPLTTTGIAVIFVIFFLFQREDLRNRFIRLTGTRDLERTTTALDDAGHRLARLFATQLALNACFGTVIGLGLAFIGVPSAPLWGLLAMILRFVPYVGPLLSAVLPLTLAAAVGDGWSMVLWTAALFAVVEPLTGQFIEPIVCGQSSGLSPVAIVIAAAFWTWLWGPLGLILSTPLTVCLVVLARHVDRLKFIDILLGDQPALTPQQANYQRMLAADPVEIIDHAAACLKDMTLLQYYDDVLLGALRLAEHDAKQGRLDDERLNGILQTVAEVVEDLREAPQSKARQIVSPGVDKKPHDNVVSLHERDAPSVICSPGLGRLDTAAAVIVAEALNLSGIGASAIQKPFSTSKEASGCKVICVCYLDTISDTRVRFIQRKLARNGASAKIVVSILGATSNRKPANVTDVNVTEPAILSLEATVAQITALVKLDDRDAASETSAVTR